ncbi:adenylyl-sulfate kinase [Candidatus Woesearchaeota archaeon]|nr:MAG: adenylyl-sulfate kinase [Candidatus Woesearchaeota archaeon]
MTKNVVWHEGKVTRQMRNELLGYENRVVWFTGLSGSGKSTLAVEVEKKLHEKGILAFILDGDNIRHGLNSDLGFSKEDRKENIRRVAEVAKLFYEAGVYVLVSFISPFRSERDYARKLIGKDFVEVFVSCPLEECMKRDPKGMYEKAKKGLIKEFTGVDSPYEEPLNPEIVVDTSKEEISQSVKKILDCILPQSLS